MYHLQHTQYFSFCSNLEIRSNQHCFHAVMSVWNMCIRKHFTHQRNFIFEFKLFSPSFQLSFVNNTVPVIHVFWAAKKFLRWHWWCFQSFSSAYQPAAHWPFWSLTPAPFLNAQLLIAAFLQPGRIQPWALQYSLSLSQFSLNFLTKLK